MSFDPALTLPASASAPTRISVHPEPLQESKVAPPSPRWRKSFQKETLGDTNQPLSFKQLVDVFNPLQHIPVIGHLYRAATGDEPSREARIVGGALFGGPLGFAIAGISAFAAQERGSSNTTERSIAANEPPPQTNQAEIAAAIEEHKQQDDSIISARMLLTPTAYEAPPIQAQPIPPVPYEPTAPVAPMAEATPNAPKSSEMNQAERIKHELILDLFGYETSAVTPSKNAKAAYDKHAQAPTAWTHRRIHA
jgi:hypothetical protein